MAKHGRSTAQEAELAAASAQASSPALDPRAYTTEDYRGELKRVKRMRRITIALCVFLALVAVLAIVAVVVLRIPGSLQSVESDDMAPVLVQGDVSLLQEIESPAQGDVVLYRDANGDEYVTRVVATSGEWVNVATDNTVVVSNGPLESASAAGAMGEGATIIASRQVPEGSCFVMSDADGQPLEALYREDSFIEQNQVIGRMSFRMWPITRLGSVS